MSEMKRESLTNDSAIRIGLPEGELQGQALRALQNAGIQLQPKPGPQAVHSPSGNGAVEFVAVATNGGPRSLQSADPLGNGSEPRSTDSSLAWRRVDSNGAPNGTVTPLRSESGASNEAGEGLPDLPDAWYAMNIQDVRQQAIEWAEKSYLERILTETFGHIGNTAKRAGIGTRALYDRMKLHGLDKADYKRRS